MLLRAPTAVLTGAWLLSATAVAGCTAAEPEVDAAKGPHSGATILVPADAPDDTVVTPDGTQRVAIVDAHQIVVARRSDDGSWGSARVVLNLRDRECGAVRATAAGQVLAVTVACDANYAADAPPTRSVALVSEGVSTWSHHDLEGEAFLPPAISPSGVHVVWPQADGLLRWSRTAGFETEGGRPADAVAVTDDGQISGAIVLADEAGYALRITEETGAPVELRLPARHNGGQAEYDGVWFDGPDKIVVSTPDGVPDVLAHRRDGRWML